MSTSTLETEPQTIADLGAPELNEGRRIRIATEIRKSGKSSRPAAALPPPPSDLESLKEDVRKLKESVEAIRDAYNRHHHSNLDGSQTSPTSVEA
jgi:hypothetical protein